MTHNIQQANSAFYPSRLGRLSIGTYSAHTQAPENFRNFTCRSAHFGAFWRRFL